LSKIIWDKRLLSLAEHVASWSKDPSTKVGAVLAHGKDVVGLGYNGFPKGVQDSEERLNDRPLKYKLTVHAEANAILMAGQAASGASLYVWPSFSDPNKYPQACHECCKLALQAGVVEFISGKLQNPDPALQQRWIESHSISKLMSDEVGAKYREVR
jgi:dCMP deaminase